MFLVVTRPIHPYYVSLLVTHLAGLMPVHFIKIFWLTIFALLLPSQAFANLIQSDSIHESKLENSELTYHHQPLLMVDQPSPHTSLQSLFDSIVFESTEETPKPLAPRPVSQTEVIDSAIAIINSSRWSASSTQIEEASEPSSEFFDDLTHVPHYKRYLHAIYDVDFWVGDAFASEHRISGWKETNALYVALNSQF
ncbi:hypothetical protein L4D20_01885 [Vibrio kyushuensis]|uniref:hypothetical protein n=1 Tax=Vibrio kyushuensis TaxID=2910249 RepID=UPI003D0CA322